MILISGIADEADRSSVVIIVATIAPISAIILLSMSIAIIILYSIFKRKSKSEFIRASSNHYRMNVTRFPNYLQYNYITVTNTCRKTGKF